MNKENKIEREEKYSSKEEKYEKIMELFNSSNRYPESFQGYRNYIMENIKKNNSELVEVYDTSRQFTLSYRVETLFFKIGKINNKLLSIGYKSDKHKKLLQIGRKYLCTYNDEIMV